MGFLNKLFGTKQQQQEEEITMTKSNIGIILGSTREGRVSQQVGEWVKELADKLGMQTTRLSISQNTNYHF
jgi:hypothetical protein